jgi:hypothetical protein
MPIANSELRMAKRGWDGELQEAGEKMGGRRRVQATKLNAAAWSCV